MADKTPEEIKAEKDEKDRATNVKKTLENKLFRQVLGVNLVRTNPFEYGQLATHSGENAYDGFSENEEFAKMRGKMNAGKTKAMREQGVYGEPSMPTNSDVSYLIMSQLREVMALSRLGELEKQAKDAGAKLDFDIPAKLKGLSYMEIIEKAQNDKGASLSEDEKRATQAYQILSQAYERACALNVADSGRFDDLNAAGKELSDAYKPKEEKSDSE